MSLWKVLTGRWGNDAGETDQVRIDPSTNALKTIEYEHSEVHGASAFHCHYVNMCTNTNEVSALGFNTPSGTKWGHLTVSVAVTSIARIRIIESPTIDVDEGTDVTIYNRKRNSDVESVMSTIEAAPEAGKASSFDETQSAAANITTTTTLDSIVIGAAGANPSSAGVGGMTRGSLEWELKLSTQYAVTVESLSDDDNYHTIGMNWYEHTDKH